MKSYHLLAITLVTALGCRSYETLPAGVVPFATVQPFVES